MDAVKKQVVVAGIDSLTAYYDCKDNGCQRHTEHLPK
jgi:hypothetical protein